MSFPCLFAALASDHPGDLPLPGAQRVRSTSASSPMAPGARFWGGMCQHALSPQFLTHPIICSPEDGARGGGKSKSAPAPAASLTPWGWSSHSPQAIGHRGVPGGQHRPWQGSAALGILFWSHVAFSSALPASMPLEQLKISITQRRPGASPNALVLGLARACS